MQFYVIKDPKAGSDEDRDFGADFEKTDDANSDDAIRCPVCADILTLRQWLPPFEIEVTTYGRHYADLGFCVADLIVSERFVEVYRNAGLTGIDNFDPVRIVKLKHRRKKPAEPVPQYFRAVVRRSQTTIDQIASRYEWDDCSKIKPCCLTGPLIRYQAQIVDMSTWDGLDIFMPRGGNNRLFSKRLVDAFMENRLNGGIFIPAETYGYDSFPWKKGFFQK